MRNKDLLYLAAQGVLNIKAHTLNAGSAYRVFKFRKALNSAIASLQESERALWKEADIEDGQAFDGSLARLREKGPSKELEQAEEKLARYLRLRESLYGEEAYMECAGTAIPYDEWRKLQGENKDFVDAEGRHFDILSGYVEILLENILWEGPKEV